MKSLGLIFSLVCCSIFSNPGAAEASPASAFDVSKFAKRVLLYPVAIAVSPVFVPLVYDATCRGADPGLKLLDNKLFLYTFGVWQPVLYGSQISYVFS